MPNFKRTLVTAALPYANGPLHIGHLAGAYIPSDMYVRFKRLNGEEILFICGSDEHGVPITISAEKEKVSPQVIVDRYHTLNKETFEKLGISFNYYARTSSQVHRKTSQEIFTVLNDKGFLVAREEPQLYDEQAQMFLPDRYVEGTCPVCGNPDARGDQCERCGTYLNQTELINPRSKVTGNKPVVRPTKHWYFALSRFQKPLEEYIESHKKDWRDTVVQAARSWLKAGLQDRPITRDLDWGVPVPLEGSEGKVLYVWFDAPIGYISATKEAVAGDEWSKWWQDPETRWIPFLGKDNIVFHTIMFPAMLMGCNEGKTENRWIIPDNVPANEFMNLEGQKLSKSRGWIIEPHDLITRFPVDLIRYTLAVTIPEQKDTDFTWKDFQAHSNNELADILGNLVNRVLTFVERNFENKVPAGGLDDSGRELLETFRTRAEQIAKLYERFKLRDAAQETMDLARVANKYFNDAEPWKLVKSDKAKAGQILYACLEAIRAISVYFEPIIPFSTKAIRSMIDHSEAETWQNAHEPKLTAGAPLGKSEILFKKIEDEQIDAETARMREMATKAEQAANAPLAQAPKTDELITIDDFKKIKLRSATIKEAERVPKSKKLIKLQIQIGTEQRQIVAGIGEKYAPEDLVGKSIIVVANLQPAKLMGNESQGMLLAVNDDKGVVQLVTLGDGVGSGLEVR